jgi:hypothetical protein
MPYAGHTLMGRQHVSLVAPHWPNEKVKATATAMAESALSIGAWHDNERDGKITSRDCGLYQINIPAEQIATAVESSLRTDSKDEAVFMKVARTNVDAAYRKYTAPWMRDGKQDYRRWQPWYAYTTGWAMFSKAWVWKQKGGEPVGPWTLSGRYLHRAIRAVANWHYLSAKDMNETEATDEANRLAVHFGITDATYYWSEKTLVSCAYPEAPTGPPADGIGPRPTKNTGV